jgi:hypothetical protein
MASSADRRPPESESCPVAWYARISGAGRPRRPRAATASAATLRTAASRWARSRAAARDRVRSLHPVRPRLQSGGDHAAVSISEKLTTAGAATAVPGPRRTSSSRCSTATCPAACSNALGVGVGQGHERCAPERRAPFPPTARASPLAASEPPSSPRVSAVWSGSGQRIVEQRHQLGRVRRVLVARERRGGIRTCGLGSSAARTRELWRRTGRAWPTRRTLRVSARAAARPDVGLLVAQPGDMRFPASGPEAGRASTPRAGHQGPGALSSMNGSRPVTGHQGPSRHDS